MNLAPAVLAYCVLRISNLSNKKQQLTRATLSDLPRKI